MKTSHLVLPSFATRGLRLLLGLSLSFSCRTINAQMTSPAHNVVPSSPVALSTPENVPADLTSDTRLDRRIRVHEIGIPLNALLLKVGREDLALSANRNCEALKIHLSLQDRSVRQLMDSLAHLVPGTWYKSPDGKAYVLRMSLAAVSRRQRWWDLFLGERQRLWETVSERSLQAMQARPQIKGEVSSADGNHEGFKQQLLAGPTFFNLLPASLQEKVAHSLNQTPSYQTRGLIWTSGMEEGGVIVPFTALPVAAQQQLSTPLRAYRPQSDTPNSNYVSFENVGSHVSAEVVDAEGDTLPVNFHLDVDIDAERPAFMLDHEGLPRKVKQMGRSTPTVWKELAAYQESRVWPNVVPAKTHLSYQNRAQVLEWLAETAHLEFVADYYSLIGGTRYATLPTELSLPIQGELNKQAGELDLSWKQAGDVYLFRNNRWYRDDQLEVPAPLLQQWLDKNVKQWAKDAARQTPLTKEEQAAQVRRMLDWQAEAVSALTPWQLFNGLAYATVAPEQKEQYAWGPDYQPGRPAPENAHTPYAPFKKQVSSFILRYSLMRFYASLSVEQRTALLTGTLDVSMLSGEQTQQSLYLQPRLAIYGARQNVPILLGVRHSKALAGLEEVHTAWKTYNAGAFAAGVFDQGTLHLVITSPTLK